MPIISLGTSMKRDVLSFLDMSDDLSNLLSSAERLSEERRIWDPPLRGKSLAMIFEKSSTRTRVSFEVGMTDLGGHALYLGADDMQLGRGETVSDTARVLSRFVDCIMYRAFSHEKMLELAENSTVPVINGLDDVEHPCQALADLLTIKQHKGRLEGLRMVYMGDGNNVCNSLMLAAALTGMHMVVSCPGSRMPDQSLLSKAASIAEGSGGSVTVEHDPSKAMTGADVVYTDVWISMGDDLDEASAEELFGAYRVDEGLMSLTDESSIFMHCLPAHRGMEVTAGVIDGPRSVVFDQAENRLHAQKAIMLWLMG